ncbi:hypothetical protein GCM10027418_04550 [Mariniluteicoccus endophyticus]
MSIDSLLGGEAVVRLTKSNRNRVGRAARAGELSRILPGTYVRAGTERRPAVRAAAIHAYDRDAVLTGASAAALHLRRDTWPEQLTFSSPRQWRVSEGWFRASRGVIAPEHVLDTPVPHVEPALSLLQIAAVEGSGPIHTALRKKKVTPLALEVAAVAHRGTRGNAARRRAARDARATPWSCPEANFHQLLRRAGITGWAGNALVRANHHWYYLDVAFHREQVAVEIDSWQFHGGFEAFQHDRSRHNDLEAMGWRVLRITPEMLDEQPGQVVAWVREALRT